MHAARSASLPVIAGALVIVAEGDQIVALSASTGEKVWSVGNRGLGLRGAGNDGTSTALVLADPKTSLFLAVSPTGAALGSAETSTPLGVPAARGGIAFVPWSNQYVSALDMASGDESGRLLTREQVSRLNFAGTAFRRARLGALRRKRFGSPARIKLTTSAYRPSSARQADMARQRPAKREQQRDARTGDLTYAGAGGN